MSGAVTYTSREEIDVHRFSWGISVGIPLLAIFFQVFLPVRLNFLAVFDLPLLITIFFAVARRPDRDRPGRLQSPADRPEWDCQDHDWLHGVIAGGQARRG